MTTCIDCGEEFSRGETQLCPRCKWNYDLYLENDDEWYSPVPISEQEDDDRR